MASTPETKAKKKLKEMLDRIPNAWHTSISDRYHAGIPDHLVIRNGVPAFIEVKADETKHLSKIQQHIAKKIISSGAEYYVAFLDKNGDLCLRKMSLKKEEDERNALIS